MENYKEASLKKLRFQTPKGFLSTEQLWDLSVEELDVLAVSFEAEVKQLAGRKSFIVKTSTFDKISKLKFEIVLDVLNTKIEENQAAQEAANNKSNNNKILALIEEKKGEDLKSKSIKELEKLLV